MSPTETTDNTSTKREVQIEVPHQEISRVTDTLVQKYQKLARLPGFRRGHIPASIIRQRFGEEIKSEVLESLVPRYFREATEKQGLVPLAQPQITDLHFHDGEPLRFKASFEVMPEIPLEGYKEIRAEKEDTAVTDAEVEEALQSLREEHATFSAIEGRPLADGDFAQAAIDGTPKDEERSPIHLDEILIEIGGKTTVQEFNDHLRGVSAGEERTFDVVYPADYSDQRLASKTVTYTVKVQAIKQKTLPELNDDFAKEMGPEFQTLDDVKKRIREGLEGDKKNHAERKGKEKIIAELIKRNDFPVPDVLVEHQVDVRLDRGLRALAAQGMRPEDMKKMDLPRLREGQRDQAVEEVKSMLLLAKVADAENIEVSDDEVAREIDALARQSNQTSDAIRARLTRDGALDRIKSRIRSEKALNFLYHQSA